MTRSILLTTLLVPVFASTVVAQVLRYTETSGTSRTYVREQRDRVVQTVDGRQTATDIQSYWRLRATVTAETSETITVGIVHDSLAITGIPPVGDLGIEALRETPIELVLTRRGAVRELEIPGGLPPVTARLDLESTYRSFFPRLPEDPAVEGFAWSDTTHVAARQNGIDLRVVRVSRYTSKGWATWEGARVVRVDYEADLTIEGKGEQQDAEIVLSGSGRSSGAFYFDPQAGVYVGSGESAEMRMVALVAAPGQNLVIPIVQNRTEKITSEPIGPM